MSVQETVRWRESTLETPCRVSGKGGENPEGSGKGRAQPHILQFAVLHTPYGRLTSRHTWRWPLSHRAILSVRIDSLPSWLFQSDFVFKVCWMVAFTHKGHEVYLSSAYGSMVFFTQQTAVYKRPAHVFSTHYPSCTPEDPLCPTHQQPTISGNFHSSRHKHQWAVSGNYGMKSLSVILDTWTPSCLSFATNGHPTLECPQCPLLYTLWEYVNLSEDCPECLKPQ